MKRYGDNVTHKDISEETSGSEAGQYTRVFLGGCGATFGSFPAPANTPKTVNVAKNHMLVELLSFLGIKRKKTQENS